MTYIIIKLQNKNGMGKKKNQWKVLIHFRLLVLILGILFCSKCKRIFFKHYCNYDNLKYK